MEEFVRLAVLLGVLFLAVKGFRAAKRSNDVQDLYKHKFAKEHRALIEALECVRMQGVKPDTQFQVLNACTGLMVLFEREFGLEPAEHSWVARVMVQVRQDHPNEDQLIADLAQAYRYLTDIHPQQVIPRLKNLFD